MFFMFVQYIEVSQIDLTSRPNIDSVNLQIPNQNLAYVSSDSNMPKYLYM